MLTSGRGGPLKRELFYSKFVRHFRLSHRLMSNHRRSNSRFPVLSRSIASVACVTFVAGSLHATDYTWQGGTTATNMLLPANWVGGIVPPNDGININLTPTDKILFAAG